MIPLFILHLICTFYFIFHRTQFRIGSWSMYFTLSLFKTDFQTHFFLYLLLLAFLVYRWISSLLKPEAFEESVCSNMASVSATKQLCLRISRTWQCISIEQNSIELCRVRHIELCMSSICVCPLLVPAPHSNLQYQAFLFQGIVSTQPSWLRRDLLRVTRIEYKHLL